MKRQVIVSFFVVSLFFLGSSVQALAAVETLPGAPAPTNQRDKFQADLFTGSSTYSYPIKVPKGTDDQTPAVSLSYNNQGNHDPSMFAGVGWQVDRDFIQRDVNYTPGDTSDDKYKLHFKGSTYDLVYNASDSLFHTKIESHLKIQQFLSGGQGSTGAYWQVTTTDGTVYRFGYASNSEFGCNGQSYDGYWNLDQVTDIHGNHIYYTYTSSSGVAYLSQIKYNNDQLREVDFTYVTNPYQIQAYLQGCSVTEGSRLSTVLVKANGNLVHEYDLSFSQAVNSQNLLGSITEKGTDGSSLPATSFDYNPEVQSLQTQPQILVNNQSIDSDIRNSNVKVIDVNGDGLPDIVRENVISGPNDTIIVHLNNGNGWDVTGQTWVNNQALDADITQPNVKLIDVNGDGLPDIVREDNNGGPNYTITVHLNNGHGWDIAGTKWVNNQAIDADISAANVKLIDVNGDGLPDIVRENVVSGPNDTFIVHLNTGSGWDITGQTWVNNQPIDTDISQSNVKLIDVNGDGLPDLVRENVISGPNDTILVHLNTGNGWQTTPQTWVNNQSLDADITQPNVTFADMNGDGLPDIVRADNNGGPSNTWSVHLNTGTGFAIQPVVWASGSSVDANTQYNDVKIVDVNGDGLPDILREYFNGGANDTFDVWSNNGYSTDSLSTIHTSQGGTVHFDYNPSTKYSNGSNLPFPLWVVKQMTLNNGMSNTQQTNDVTAYSYANGLYSYQNHEFRGFGQVNETDPNTAKKVFSFAQDDAAKGKLTEVDTNDSQNNPFEKTVNTWSNSQTNGIYTVNLTQEMKYTYDGSASNPKIAENDYQYDTYGNVTKKSALGDTSTSADNRFIYNVYTVNPSSWIVNKVSDTYVNKSDDSTKVSETWNYYDGNVNLTDAPTKGDLTKQVKWLSGGSNPTTTFTYDSYGNQTQVTDPNNHSTQFQYAIHDSTHTYVDHTVNAKNQTSDAVTDLGTGNVLSKTDPNGFMISFSYDPFGRVSKEIDPYDTSTYPTINYQYFDGAAPQGVLVSKRKTSGAAGTLDAYTFVDGFGRTLQTRVPAEDTAKQIVAETYYDPNGKVSKQSVPHLDTLSTSYVAPVSGILSTNMSYDPMARVTTLTNPQGTTKTTSYNHWTQTNTDENGHQIKKYFDAFNNISQVDEYSGSLIFSTSFIYDALNNLTKTTDALGNNTNYTYDTLNRQTALADLDMGTWNYQYDGVDNQTQQTDARGKSTTKTYDQLNRLATVSFPTDPTVTYTYDTNTIGTLAQVQDGAGTVSYTYDNRLRKTQEQRVTDGITWTTQFTYDAANRLLTRTNPDSEVLTYGYNAQGEVGSLNGIVSNVDYNALGKVTTKALANSLTTNYSYNTNDFRLNRIQTGTVQDVGYTYDNVGNVASTTDNLTSKTQSFTYDNLNRLTAASQSDGSYNFTYAYDAVGDLKTFTGFGGTTQYTYGTTSLVHAVASATTNTMVYDDTLASGWTDASFNATDATTTAPANVYSGTVALVSYLGANGGLDFKAPSGMRTDGSDTLHIVLKASQAGQQYEVYADSVFGQPLSAPVSLANYASQPNSTGWTVYNIPLADLGATNVPLGDIVIHNPYATDQQAVYVDQVELTSGNPPTLTKALSDDWSSGTINSSRWNNNWSSGHASVINQQLNITSSTTGGYFGQDTRNVPYDLTGSSAFTQLVDAGNQSLTSWEVYPVYIFKNNDPSNQLQWRIAGNTIYAEKRVAWAATAIASAAYNPSVHKWFKIREANGTIYWDYSTDGLTWTNFTSTASPFAVTAMNLGQSVGTWQSEATATSATFDNFNVSPPATPLASSLTEDWSSGAISSTKWTNNWSSGHASVINQQLNITSTTAANYFGLDARNVPYDLTGSYVFSQLVNAGNQSLTSWEVYPVYIFKNNDPSNQLQWRVAGNTIYAEKKVANVLTTVSSATYNSSVHKWFRIRESGGTIYWDYSAGGLTWTNFTSTATPFVVTAMNPGLAIGTWQSEATTTSATFDNFSIATGCSLNWTCSDIGSPALAGSTSLANNVFTLQGAGIDIWGTYDQFQYAYQSLNGDGSIIARVTSQTNTDPWAKAGVMIKESATANANYVMMAVTPGNGLDMQYTFNGNVYGGTYTFPNVWLKVSRAGNTFTAYKSTDGTSWTTVGSTTVTMNSNATVGLFVTSHNGSQLSTVTFDNISITHP